MISRRPAVAMAAAALGLGLLAGCEKPTPEVSANSGGDFVQAEATLYCFEGQVYATGGHTCREEVQSPPSLTVRPGEQVAIEVPKDIRERGWFVRIVTGDQKVSPGPIQKDRTYFTFSADFSSGNALGVQVVALPASPNAGEISGVWEISLLNGDAS